MDEGSAENGDENGDDGDKSKKNKGPKRSKTEHLKIDATFDIHPRLSKYNNFGYILTSLFMDSSRFKNRLELIEKRC
jgi:hypothetical protein